MRSGKKEKTLDPWMERREGMRGSLSFLLLAATPPPEAPVSKASSRPRAWLTRPASGDSNPDVRPEFLQPVANAHVGCHSIRFRLIPSRRLVAGSAPMQRRFL